MKKHSTTKAILCFASVVFAVTTRSAIAQISLDSTVSLSGLIEACYVYDFDRPASNTRPFFLYNHTRTNEVDINLAFTKLRYASEDTRANLALMTGTYAEANLAAEPPIWRNVFEANAGVRLAHSANLWLDGGIFPSHIGFETAVSKDNWTLTRSILAENSPYYESGARITYGTADNRWTICVHVLDGWQQIQRPAGSTSLGWGTQAVYQPSADILINSSTFIGNIGPDSTTLMRYFHNLYGIFSLSPSIGLILGFDVGAQQRSSYAGGYNVWYSPVVILRYTLEQSMRVAARLEYYRDRDGVIVSTGTPNGFQVLGSSANFDYSVTKNSLWRIEARLLWAKDRLFVKSNGSGDTNLSIATSLSIFF